MKKNPFQILAELKDEIEELHNYIDTVHLPSWEDGDRYYDQDGYSA